MKNTTSLSDVVALLLSVVAGAAIIVACSDDDCAATSTCEGGPGGAGGTSGSSGATEGGGPNPWETPIAFTAPDTNILVHGQKRPIKLTFTAKPAGPDPLVVKLIDPPAGITSDALSIGGSENSADLAVTASKDVTQGDAKLRIEASVGGFVATKEIAITVQGASGEIDTTFANQGVIELFPNSGQQQFAKAAVATLPDGRFYLCGETRFIDDSFASKLRRFQVNGTPDTTFNTTGSLDLDFFCRSLEAKSDKLIVFGAFGYFDLEAAVVAHLLPSGANDPGWNGGLKFQRNHGTYFAVRASRAQRLRIG